MPDFTQLTSNVREIFVALFPVVSSEGWTNSDWTDEQRVELNKFIHLLNDVYNDKLRRPYDRTIWNGHKSGKVVKSLEPVRQETVRKDAKSTEAVTPDNIFDSLLGIEATVEVETPTQA